VLMQPLEGADQKRMASAGTHDDFETRFWLSMVTAGAWVTLLMCLAGGIYAAFFADPDHQVGLAVTVALAAVSGVAVLYVVPWRRVIASSWRETAFFAWTVSTIGVIAVTAAFDGGAVSPLAMMLFLPAVFASLAYPLRLVVAAAILAELAFFALMLIEAPGTGYAIAFCSALAGMALLAVWQAANHDSWRGELARSSVTDPLTGVLNRRGFEMASRAAFSLLDRHERPVTLLIIDLDLFKAYNDAHGHQAGDELLCWVAAQLAGAVRPTDAVARLGGDEFSVLLPETGAEEAGPVIERIEAALDRRASHCLGRATAPEQGNTFDELYRVADADLYHLKLARRRSDGSPGRDGMPRVGMPPGERIRRHESAR
jgi:diguanylate cyclase (GGDEF)-like protein